MMATAYDNPDVRITMPGPNRLTGGQVRAIKRSVDHVRCPSCNHLYVTPGAQRAYCRSCGVNLTLDIHLTYRQSLWTAHIIPKETR